MRTQAGEGGDSSKRSPRALSGTVSSEAAKCYFTHVLDFEDDRGRNRAETPMRAATSHGSDGAGRPSSSLWNFFRADAPWRARG